MAAKQGLTLGREKRLKSRKRISLLFEKGDRFHLPSMRVHHMPDGSREGIVKAGFSVSSRIFKRAVDRNRIKRLLREAWRKELPLLDDHMAGMTGIDIFLIYTGKELPSYQEVLLLTQKAIQKLIQTYPHVR